MNRDEATEYLIDISYKFGNISVEYLTEKDGEKMREAINVLTNEQQTCEDAVSRQAVEDAIANTIVNGEELGYAVAYDILSDLPPVNPQPKTTVCEDAVSREAVLGLFAQNADAIRPYSKTWEEVKALPSVKPQPKTGHWIRMKAYEKWGCSECNTVFRFTFKEHDYCPKCGCRMVEPQEMLGVPIVGLI